MYQIVSFNAKLLKKTAKMSYLLLILEFDFKLTIEVIIQVLNYFKIIAFTVFANSLFKYRVNK